LDVIASLVLALELDVTVLRRGPILPLRVSVTVLPARDDEVEAGEAMAVVRLPI